MYFPRRQILKHFFAAAAATTVVAAGFWKPRPTRAAEWPRDAYSASTVADALRNLYGTSEVIASPTVKVRAPTRVQSGAVVPVAVSTDLPDVRAISILIKKNSPPLAAHVTLNGAVAFFAINVRIPSTSAVSVVVNAGGKLYTPKENIAIAVGA
jgi:sulfur-oxidizing protein SoxY